VSANIQLAHALGLDGTPAILVGTEGGMSRRLPTYSFEIIQEAVEAILGGSGLN
jgi:protein-disulfide isomerase